MKEKNINKIENKKASEYQTKPRARDIIEGNAQEYMQTLRGILIPKETINEIINYSTTHNPYTLPIEILNNLCGIKDNKERAVELQKKINRYLNDYSIDNKTTIIIKIGKIEHKTKYKITICNIGE